MWRKVHSGLPACLVLLLVFSLNISVSQAKSSDAYNLIGAVNQLRTSRGLPSYEINPILMSVAQAHSDYQASIHQITHTGPGGSRPRDRAIAAGYGGGASVFVSENIAGGTNMTYQMAVQMWQGDDIHLNTMISPNYTDVGAGVATDGEMNYFTLDVGYIAGSPGSGATLPPGSTTSAPLATPIVFYPVLVSTPNPDGSIVHIVQPGQTLWTIAAVYKVSLSDLLQLNGLGSNPVIHPGDKILIKEASKSPNISPSGTTKPLKATSTLHTTKTPSIDTITSRASQPPNSNSPPPQPKGKPAGATVKDADVLLWIVAALVFCGTLLMVVGYALNRRGQRSHDQG